MTRGQLGAWAGSALGGGLVSYYLVIIYSAAALGLSGRGEPTRFAERPSSPVVAGAKQELRHPDPIVTGQPPGAKVSPTVIKQPKEETGRIDDGSVDDVEDVDPDYARLVAPMEEMTTAQKQEYVKTLNGRKINWLVYVMDARIGSDGSPPEVSVVLKPPTKDMLVDALRLFTFSDRLFEFKVSKVEALRVHKGQQVRLVGRLANTSSLGGILTFDIEGGHLKFPK